MSEEVIGVARINVVTDTATMETGVDRAKRALANLGEEASKQFDGANIQVKKLAETLVRQTDLVGKTRLEQIAYNAQLKIGGQLGQEIADRAIKQQKEQQAAIAATAQAELRVQQAREAAAAAARDADVADKARLARRRAEATEAFSGPSLAQQRAEAAALQESNGRRERLVALLNTERGQRILAAEATRAQATASRALGVAQRGAATGAAALAGGIGNGYKSTKELAFALRTLPAQFTDIAVSLQSGQRPLTVLLQQGGQLKDMFGGIGPAFKAIGGYALRLVNPFTVAAAALGTLVYTAYQAEQNQYGLAKALLLTGSYAGKSAQQLEALSESVAKTANTSVSAARDAVTQVTSTGRFTGDQFVRVAEAAARMQEATGQSIDATISKFSELTGDPVKGLLKLNETEHFLTQAQLDRVRALQEEGRTQDAVAEGARIYADHLGDVAKAADAARPHLAALWAETKKGASDALSATENFAEFLAAAAAKYRNETPLWQRLIPVIGVTKTIKALYTAEPAVAAPAASAAGTVDTTRELARQKLAQEALTLKNSLLTREEQKTKELAQLDKLRAQYSDQEYATLRKRIELKFTEHKQASAANLFASLNSLRDKAANSLDAARQSAAGSDNAQVALLKSEVEQLQALARAGGVAIAKGASLSAVQREVATSAAMVTEAFDLQAKQLAGKNAAAIAAYQAAIDDQISAQKEQMALQVASASLGRKEAQRESERVALIQKNANEILRLERQRAQSGANTTVIDGQIAAAKRSLPILLALQQQSYEAQDAAQSDWLNGAERAYADYLDTVANVADQTYTLFANAFTGMSDAISNFVLTGKLDFKGFVASILSDFAKMESRVLASRILQGIFGSFLGGATATSFNSDNTFFSPSANGNVFTNSPSLSAYSGSVVSRPTMFAFARGAGLMGEAGPEAVMPLKRGPDGKLGVAASGGGVRMGDVVVNVNIAQNGADSASVDAAGSFGRQLGDQMKATAQKVLRDAMRPGGALYKSRNGVGAMA